MHVVSVYFEVGDSTSLRRNIRKHLLTLALLELFEVAVDVLDGLRDRPVRRRISVLPIFAFEEVQLIPAHTRSQ